MKRIFLLAVCLLPCFAYAQSQKGQIYLGGSLSSTFNTTQALTTTNSSIANPNTFSVSPALGVFLNPRLSLGMSLGYSYTSAFTAITPITYAAINTFTVSPTVRRYIPLNGLSHSFYIALQGQVNYSYANVPSTVLPLEQNQTYGVSFKPIFIYFIDYKWGIEGSLGSIGFSNAQYVQNSIKASNSNITFNAGGSISLGVAYYFKRKVQSP